MGRFVVLIASCFSAIGSVNSTDLNGATRKPSKTLKALVNHVSREILRSSDSFPATKDRLYGRSKTGFMAACLRSDVSFLVWTAESLQSR